MPYGNRLSFKDRSRLALDFTQGFSVDEVAKRYNVSHRTVQRILAEFEIPKTRNVKNKKRRKTERKERNVAPCGTNAAYSRHLKRREIACDACLVAHSRYNKEWELRNNHTRLLIKMLHEGGKAFFTKREMKELETLRAIDYRDFQTHTCECCKEKPIRCAVCRLYGCP